MKRAITSVIAAGLALGTMAPAAFAATTTSSYQYNSRQVSIGSYNTGVKGVVAQDGSNMTEFLPFYYVEQGLKSLGYTVTWDGQHLNIVTPSSVTVPDLSNVNPGLGGAVQIEINGKLVQYGPRVVAKDPLSGVQTSFMPIYYVDKALALLGFTNNYDGRTWTLTPPAPAKPVAVTTGVEGFVTTLDATTNTQVPVAGATVTDGVNTVTTNADGYYSLPALPGQDTVTVSKPGYFNTKDSAPVAQNNLTSDNLVVSKIDANQLAVEGTVINSVTGAPVAGATVQLQEYQGGQWVNVGAAVPSSSTGTYGFYNSQATPSAAVPLSSQGEFTDVYGARENLLPADVNAQLRVQVSKGLAQNNITYGNVFHDTTTAFSISNDGPVTKLGTSLAPVAAINHFNISATLNSKLTQTTDTASVKLINSDGQTVLNQSTAWTVNLAQNATTGAVTGTLDASAGALALPTGTYYLVIQGTNAADATEVVPVQVTEGQNVTASTTINQAQNLTATGSFQNFDTTAAANNTVTGTADVWYTVNGVDVLVATAPANFVYTAANTSVSPATPATLVANVPFAQLDTASYKVTFSGNSIVGTPSTTTTIRSGASVVNTADVSLSPAGWVTGTIVPTPTPTSTGNAQVSGTAELLNASGSVVATKSFDVVYVGGVVKTGTDQLEFDGVAPGSYTLKLSAPGYSDYTSSQPFNVTEFQANAEGNLVLNAQKQVSLQGYIRYANDFSAVQASTTVQNSLAAVAPATSTTYPLTVTAYDTTGNYVASGTFDPTTSTYSFAAGALSAGTYVIVVRAPGQFETSVQTVNVNAGTNTYNFAVTQGAQGLLRLDVIGGGSDFTGHVQDATVTITDARYDSVSGNGGGSYSAGWVTNNGEYDTDAVLPAGTYTVAISAPGYHDTTVQVTVAPNGTTYQTVTMTPDVNGVTYQVNGTVNLSGLGDTYDGYVVALDSNGNVVDKAQLSASTNGAYTLNLPDGNYTIAVVNGGDYSAGSKGDIVAQQSVVVNNYNLYNVNFLLTLADRYN